MVLKGNGEDLEHLVEYTAATVDGEGRQEMVYLGDLDEACLDIRVDATHGVPRKNTSWQGSLQQCLCLSMEKDSIFVKSRVLSPKLLPYQWSEHGPGT